MVVQVEFSSNGGISISESFTISGPEEMAQMMGMGGASNSDDDDADMMKKLMSF